MTKSVNLKTSPEKGVSESETEPINQQGTARDTLACRLWGFNARNTVTQSIMKTFNQARRRIVKYYLLNAIYVNLKKHVLPQVLSAFFNKIGFFVG